MVKENFKVHKDGNCRDRLHAKGQGTWGKVEVHHQKKKVSSFSCSCTLYGQNPFQRDFSRILLQYFKVGHRRMCLELKDKSLISDTTSEHKVCRGNMKSGSRERF